MNKQAESRQLALEVLMTRPPDSLFAEPVEYVFADHFRQRTLCRFLDDIADAKTADVEVVNAVLAFLKSEMGLHVLDEEEYLFPLLRRRAEPEDEINIVLGQLSQEHAADEADGVLIVKLLETLKSSNVGHVLDGDAVKLLKRFAANERQHLIVENAIVLPLARARLTDQDQRRLGRRMAARRGIEIDD
jgi:iron-sulfur cluster repair protein YtfE (RIC family)